MDKRDAERISTEFLKPIFGFALKNCRNVQDAEDLSQEIIAKVFAILIVRDDIVHLDKFIWTIAHNQLSNYYRDKERRFSGIAIDEVSDILEDRQMDLQESMVLKESIEKLQTEIAYLSKIQRQIVIAYYFENKRQQQIAEELNISVGTVKWHLFEAKKDLKRGMDMKRVNGELKFNPVKLQCSINGSVGTKSPNEFLRSLIAQNICFSVRNTAKTINEIAEELGVSPVYVENEVEFLEEYDFLVTKDGRKYIANFVISESTEELMMMRDKIYKRAAELYANDLYDELTASDILDDDSIICGQTDGEVSLHESEKVDKNFLLWSLIPYIASWSGNQMTKRISFEEVASVRPDGALNIYNADVISNSAKDFPEDYVNMRNWCGPMWNSDERERITLWQTDSQWSERKAVEERNFAEESAHVIKYFNAEKQDKLSKLDYAYLVERGYVKTNGDYEGNFKSVWQIVILADEQIEQKLIAIGDKIRKKHQEELEALKEEYVRAILKTIPSHLKKVKEYELQYVFECDGWFLLHCVTTLLKNGKLKEPTKNQRKSLSTLLINKKESF